MMFGTTDPTSPPPRPVRVTATGLGVSSPRTTRSARESEPGVDAGRPVVLVCDDDPLIRLSVTSHLQSSGFTTIEARDGAEGVAMIREHAPGCVILDVQMPRMDGLSALRALREDGNEIPVVVITGAGGIDSAITATQLGAGAYLQKPIDLREVTLAVQRVLADDRLKREVSALRGRRTGYGEFIGRSAALEPLFSDLAQLEHVTAPTILILGESGTGKDVLAHTIHERGPRRTEVFVEVDCTALPEHLVESELFGHERGAFTDARNLKRGLFETAAGGIVFLDEIGELPLGMQAKLLRALENRTFRRVGGVANLRLEASVIAATNRDLREEVAAGRFREDLFYRLNVVTLRLPPLRERREDVPLLASRFVERFNREFGCHIQGIEDEALARMMAYRWPGNVRELKNMLERIAILEAPSMISVNDLPPEVKYSSRDAVYTGASEVPGCPFKLPSTGIDLDQVERGLVIQALAMTGNNKTAAAKLLGISRFQLRNRVAKYGLED